ncbi:MAG: mechanosensitive ion channel family protein [Halanaerobiales bacterium]
MIELKQSIEILDGLKIFVYENILNINILMEAIVIFILYLLARFVFNNIVVYAKKIVYNLNFMDKRRRKLIINEILQQFIFVSFIWTVVLIAEVLNIHHFVGTIAGNLFTAWVIIKIISIMMPEEFYVRIIAAFIWFVAALRILGIYKATLDVLNNIAFKSGNIEISLLLVIKGLIFFVVFFWFAKQANQFLNKKITKSENFIPSVKALLNKLIKFSLYTIAFLITLSSIGIDLSALAFLGGAVGVGLGFGLQKIVSNFISGIIILMDRSIKPGDVVEISNVYGKVKSLGTRFVSVVTLSGKEYLIPNENFITEEVINLSYSDELVRIEIPVGVGYDSDMEKVRSLLLKAVGDRKRIVDDPGPNCLMAGFGDSTVNFKLRFWINDPERGISNIKSEVLFSIWKLFKENEIHIAFPQQDLHFESISPEMLEELNKLFYKKQNNGKEAAVSREEEVD